MKLRSALLTLSLSVFAASAFAQANSFQLINSAGRTVGKASYTIDKTKDGGLKVSAKFEYRTGGSATVVDTGSTQPTNASSNVTDNQYSSEYKVDANGNYLTGSTQNNADQMRTSFSPSKTRDNVVIAQIQGGTGLGGKTLPMPRPDFLVAPDYDPSAMQVLITNAIAHPHPDHLYLLLVPGGAKGANQALYVTIADPTAATGTLDAKPVTLKHYALGWNKAKGDLYTDENGTLMQLTNGPINITYVRTKFAVDK